MAKHEIEMHVKPILDGPVVRPGDTLVARVNPGHGWKPEQVSELVDGIKELLPGVNVVVLTADQLVIYRPETSDDND